MYPRSLLCKEANIKQHTSSQEELQEIGKKEIWKSRFTCLFYLHLYRTIIFKLIIRQLITNNQFRARHCTHTNTAFLTEVGRKVSDFH